MGITHNLSLEMYFISVSGNNTHPPIREVSGTKRNQINVGIFGGIIGAIIATVACGITFYFLRKRFALLEVSTFFKALLWQIYFPILWKFHQCSFRQMLWYLLLY